MSQTPTTIRYRSNGFEFEIFSRIEKLVKERSDEILYTSDGHRIALEDLLSLGTVHWKTN